MSKSRFRSKKLIIAIATALAIGVALVFFSVNTIDKPTATQQKQTQTQINHNLRQNQNQAHQNSNLRLASPLNPHSPTLLLSPSNSIPLVLTADFLAEFPHDPSAFTQGLEYHRGILYESTGLYGRSTLRRVDPLSGSVLASVSLPAEYFGEGITIVDSVIYYLTWQNRVGFIFSLEFEQLGEFAISTEGWGLTHDKSDPMRPLILSDGSSNLYWIERESFTVVKTVEVRSRSAKGIAAVARLNELEWIDGLIWANIWLTNKIAIINPESGFVVRWLLLDSLTNRGGGVNSDAVPNGIAFDEREGKLLLTGKLWKSSFSVDKQKLTAINEHGTPDKKS